MSIMNELHQENREYKMHHTFICSSNILYTIAAVEYASFVNTFFRMVESFMKIIYILDWGDGSAIRNTVYSSRGPVFNSQHPNDSSQLQLHPRGSDALFWPLWGHRQNETLMNIK